MCAADIWCYSCGIHSAWRQVLQEFCTACMCGTVYARHWKNKCSPGSLQRLCSSAHFMGGELPQAGMQALTEEV